MDSTIDELALEILKLSKQRDMRPYELLREYIDARRVKQEDYDAYVGMLGPLARKQKATDRKNTRNRRENGS